MAVTGARRARGSVLVAPLVGAALGLVVLAGLTTSLAQAARWVIRAEKRMAVASAAERLLQALAFDLRQAGWDPTGAAAAGLVQATPTALELRADLDGDGVVDAASAERVRYRYVAPQRTVSRLLGAQSMPLADDVTELTFAYLGADGRALTLPPAGLVPSDLPLVRAIRVGLVVSPPGGVAVRRSVAIALRGGD